MSGALTLRDSTIGLIGLSLLFAAAAFGAEGGETTVRVAILRHKSPIVLRGGPFEVSDGSKAVTVPTNPLRITARGKQLHLGWEGGESTVKTGARITSPATMIRVESAPYRGTLVVHANGQNRILVVNDLDVEDYLKGIINHEISSKWPIEAVKAQVIASRSYVLYKKQQPKDPRFDVEATVLDQVYKGSIREDDAGQKAVDETRGLVLTYDTKVIEAYYHSCCGGQTESAGSVWGRERPYLRSVQCGFDADCPNTYWDYETPLNTVEKALGIRSIQKMEVVSRYPSGRVRQVRVTTPGKPVVLTGKELREKIGFNRIRSTNMKIVPRKGGFKFVGTGSGHGVGLCQWGARGMALEGKTFEEILKAYYVNAEITGLY